jgi:anti-sigma factor RsiW
MNNFNCEYIREVYPDVLNGTLDPAQAFIVRKHIDSCDECRADTAIIEQIRAARIPVPSGLHERVMQAALRPVKRWSVRRSDLAMAATLAAVLIGGTLLKESKRTDADTVATPGLGFVSVEDAMLTGKGSIEDLSVEELEKLLGEIES